LNMAVFIAIVVALVLIGAAYFIGENRGEKTKTAERTELEALRAEFDAQIKKKLGLK
jgi:hypothetical protein